MLIRLRQINACTPLYPISATTPMAVGVGLSLESLLGIGTWQLRVLKLPLLDELIELLGGTLENA
jgi:hypothetical protein